MIINKNLNLIKIYKILEKFIEDNSYPLEDRIMIYRLINKMSDTPEFCQRVNREFSAYKLKYKKQKLEDKLNNREEIDLNCGFSLIPSGKSNWRLYFNYELFLDTLDFTIAKRIAFDINVAFNIKASQLENQLEKSKRKAFDSNVILAMKVSQLKSETQISYEKSIQNSQETTADSH